MSAEQCTSNPKINRNKRRSASDSGIPCDSIKSCRYNIADFQNCKLVLFNENLPPGSQVNVLSYFEKKTLTENKCNRNTLLLSETENRTKTRSPKKSDSVNLRVTRSRNSDVSIPLSPDIGSGISSSTELKSTEKVKTNLNNCAKKKIICTRELVQPIDNSKSFEIAKSSVPRKTSDAICISPKTKKRLSSRNVKRVPFCDSDNSSGKVTEKDRSRILEATNEKEKISAQANVPNVSGDISVEVIVPANCQNPNSRLGENLVENSRIQVTCNNQFNSKYRVKKSNVQLSVVTSFLSYTVLDNNLPSGSTEDLHLDESTVPPSDCSESINSLLDQSIKEECESHVDIANDCGNAKTPANHKNQTISTDVFIEPSLSDRNQSLPLRINSAEYVKRFPRKRSKVAAENSGSEDNTDSELSSLCDLVNSVSSSTKKVTKRNGPNSHSKLGTTSTGTHAAETSIDTSLGARDDATTVLRETEQSSVPVPVVQAPRVLRKRGRPLKKRAVPPSPHNCQNALLPPDSTELPLQHNVTDTTVSQHNSNPSLSNCEDDVYTLLLQKYTDLFECNLRPRVYLKRLEPSRCLKRDPEPSTSQQIQQGHLDVNLTSEINIKSEPESIEESDWPYNNNMSPLYIKMRPEDNVTVDMRDLTSTASLVMLDIATGANHSGTDSSGNALEYVVRRINIPGHDNDADKQTVCVSHKPSSSSNELHDKSDTDGDGMCNPKASVKSTKTVIVNSIRDTSENVVKCSDDIANCETSQIVTSEYSSECADLNRSSAQNITACSIQSPDSSTAVNGISKDKPQKLELNKVPKSKSKFNVHNFVKSELPNESSMVQEISEQSNITESTVCNVDSEKETCNFTNIDTKSRRKVRNGRYSAVKEPGPIESKTNLPNREQNVSEDTKTHGEPDINDPESNIKTTKRCRNSLKRNKVPVNSEEQCETPEKPLLKSVKSHEETSKNSTERKTKSRTKCVANLIQTTDPVAPEEPKSAEGVWKSADKVEKSSSKDVNSSEETPINRSKKKFKQKSNHRMSQNDEPSVAEQSCLVEDVTKLEDTTVLGRAKSSKETHTCHSKKETKSKLKANSEDAVSEKSRTDNVTDAEDISILDRVEYPEDTHVSRSRGRFTSKVKHITNHVERDEPIEPAVPVNVMKSIDKKKKKKKKKNKSFLEEVSETKTEPKLKWKMKLGKHVLTKTSRKHIFEDTSDEDEISVLENIESKLPIKSTTEVSSILEENEKFSKKTNKEDMIQKDFDHKDGRKTETKLKKKIKLDENKQNTVPTEHFVVKGTSKLANEKQSSELENVESKLSVNPSTTQVLSKFGDNGKFHKKNNEQLAPCSKDVQKKTEKKEVIQKDFDNLNITAKKVIKKSRQNIRLEENKQTTVPTEYCGIKTTSKLADKKQSSEIENLEPKLPTVPVTIDKLKRIPKLSEKCGTNLENKEESAPAKESEVEKNPKEMNEQENLALRNLKLSENWNVYPISPILMTTETLEKRLADAGLIAPLNKNSYSELRRRAAQLPRIFNDETKLQEISEPFLFDNRNSNGKALVNPVANASEPSRAFSSSLDENNCESYLAALGITKLPDKKVPSTNMDSHETTKPNRLISFDTNKETTTAREPFLVEGITKIMPNTENSTSKNAMLSREADFPGTFLVPSVPQRKRIRINTDTNIEKEALPSKNNTDYDSCEDGIEKKMRTTSEECSAKNKHSFNFVDMSVTPTETKRPQKVKIKRPEMSDILTRTVKRKPLEDDLISIYAGSICNDGIFVKKDFDLDDKSKAIAPLDPNAIVSEWIRDTSGHATDNATSQNTNSKQIEERFSSFKYPRINYNSFAEDEEMSPINNSVIDKMDMAQNTTKRPCLSVTEKRVTKSYNLDPLYLFNDVCKNVTESGICKRYRCMYQHALPINWEITLQNMPKDTLRNLYNNTKRDMHLYIFKKIFPIVAKQLGFERDYNSVISLVKDVLEINIDSDRTPYINAIIDALRSIGLTFNSVIEVIFNSAFVARNLKELLTDILINICVEQGDIENSWSTMQLLMKYRNYHVDAGIIKAILRKCLEKSKLQKELCLKVYSDLISCISDDKLAVIFESLLNDYIECMRTLGLSNEAETLYERTVALSVQSSGGSQYTPTGSVRSKFVSEVSPKSIVPLFDIKFPFPPKLPSSPPTFTQNGTPNSPPNFNAPCRRPIVNKVMPWNNKPDLLLKDALADKPANVPSTSATVAPYVEEMQTCSMSSVKQAIFTENLSQLMSLILQYKEGDLTDEFLKTCLDAMQESAHNFAVLFRNLCQSVIVFQNEHDVKMDKSLEYVFKTIGTNLIIYSTHMNKWEQAYHIYQTLRDLYNESDIINVKMLMVEKPSYIKRLLIICRIFIKKDDCRHAWEFFKGNSLHTSSCWTEVADQQDIEYRDLVFTELMTGLNKGKQWQTAFTIVEYILKQNLNELDPIVDTTIQMAVKNDCHVEYITSFMSVCPVWYNRIHCHTFRVIVVKLVRDRMYKMALTVYRQGCEMEIYPHLFGNEKCLEFSTHYVLEEILLMLKVFLQNMVNFMPIRHAVVIKVQQSTEVTDDTRTELPSLLFQHNMSCETMHVRIVNILNNYIKPPIRVVNKYSQLEITPAELEKHLEVRRKWNQY